ncbi:rhodanese-like domain-containing protein [Amycolatopsis magusensis]|uniref:rhodanese-like domain-containing protein n=1 Tax=Amycolatopsis magusensis TaxID=882444 RepID=UPI003C303A9F
MTTISRAEVREHIEAGTAVVLEALPASYYEDQHLPGALNMPVDEAGQLAPRLIPGQDSTVIVYCANLPCGNSRTVAAELRRLGYRNVFDYAEGKQDWIEAGLPVESGAAMAN